MTNARTWLLALLLASASLPLQADEALDALIGNAAKAAKSGDAPAAIEALQQALVKLRVDAPLVLKPFVVVARPAKFYGDYAPRQNHVFRSGEEMNFYLEPKNLTYPRSKDGVYTPAFDVDIQILTAAGAVVATKEKFGALRLKSRSPVQDIFMNLKLRLNGAPAGGYELRFVVRDVNSKKSATLSQPITLK